MALVQLHWQNRDNLDQTEFIAQGDFASADEMHGWAREIIDRRGSEMPDGWIPLIVAEDHPRFVLQVAPA